MFAMSNFALVKGEKMKMAAKLNSLRQRPLFGGVAVRHPLALWGIGRRGYATCGRLAAWDSQQRRQPYWSVVGGGSALVPSFGRW
jgi:hypothetical protein